MNHFGSILDSLSVSRVSTNRGKPVPGPVWAILAPSWSLCTCFGVKLAVFDSILECFLTYFGPICFGFGPPFWIQIKNPRRSRKVLPIFELSTFVTLKRTLCACPCACPCPFTHTCIQISTVADTARLRNWIRAVPWGHISACEFTAKTTFNFAQHFLALHF